MATDDRLPLAGRRRFVPTLTEVVDAAELVPDEGLPPAPAALADVRVGLSAQQVLELLGPDLEQQIADAIVHAVNDQMLGIQARVRRTVADVVQDAVDAALRRVEQEKFQGKPGGMEGEN